MILCWVLLILFARWENGGPSLFSNWQGQTGNPGLPTDSKVFPLALMLTFRKTIQSNTNWLGNASGSAAQNWRPTGSYLIMSVGNVRGSRQRKCRNCLSPDNTTVALKGSIKIGQLCWHFSCESCSWASGSVDTDHFIFTQRLWRGGKVGFALSWSCGVPRASWCLSPLHAARGSVKARRLADEAMWPTPKFHAALPRAAPLLRFHGR